MPRNATTTRRAPTAPVARWALSAPPGPASTPAARLRRSQTSTSPPLYPCQWPWQCRPYPRVVTPTASHRQQGFARRWLKAEEANAPRDRRRGFRCRPALPSPAGSGARETALTRTSLPGSPRSSSKSYPRDCRKLSCLASSKPLPKAPAPATGRRPRGSRRRKAQTAHIAPGWRC